MNHDWTREGLLDLFLVLRHHIDKTILIDAQEYTISSVGIANVGPDESLDIELIDKHNVGHVIMIPLGERRRSLINTR